MIFSVSIPGFIYLFCYFSLFLSFFVLFLNLLLVRTPRRHKTSSDSHSIYVPQAQQNSLQSALHRAAEYIQKYVRVDHSATTQASKHKQVKCCRESNHVHECFVLFSFLTFVLRKAITICTSVQFIFQRKENNFLETQFRVCSCRPQSATTQASRHKQVKCCREPPRVLSVFPFFHVVVVRKATTINTIYFFQRKEIIFQKRIFTLKFDFFPSTTDTQPCDGPPSRLHLELRCD